MPLKIELFPDYQLLIKDNNPQALLLPPIELTPVVSSNLPHIYRITISVSGTDSELAKQIESAYKSYNTGKLVKLSSPLRTKQSDCRFDKPIPENFNCILKVSVDYYDSDLEGSPDSSKPKNTTAECYIFFSSVLPPFPVVKTPELPAEKPAAIPPSPPVMENPELSAEKPAAIPPSPPVMENPELSTEKPKIIYHGWFAIDFGTSNSTVTLYDPKLIVSPNSLPKEQEQYLRKELAKWVNQRSTNNFSNPENEEWERLLNEFKKHFQDLNINSQVNLGDQIFLGTNSIRLLDAIRLLEISLSQRREQFRRAVSNELNQIYYQVSRVPPLEWQSLIPVELNRNSKLSEIPSELEIVSFNPSLPQEDPFKVKVLMGERARQDRKKALDEGLEIEGKFHHSPKRYLGQQERSIPVTLDGKTANIEVKKLIQAAWAHLIELTDDYRKEYPDKCSSGKFSKGVVTYPTIAPPVVRFEIEQLVKELGIDDVQIAYDEAVSAAIFYLWREFGGDLNTGIESFKTRCRSEGDTWSQNVLILDIGGGTTDLALIRLTLKEINPFEPHEDRGDGGRYYVLTPKLLGSSGHLQLGGELITLRLFLLLKTAIADCLLTAVTEERLQQDVLKIQTNELSERFIVDGKFKKGTLLACVDKEDPESDSVAYKDALGAAEKVLPTRWKESRQSRRAQTFYTLWDYAENAKIHLGQKDQANDFILEGQIISEILLQNGIDLPSDSFDSLSVKLTVQQFEKAVIPVLQEAIGIANGLMINSLKTDEQPVDWLILSGKTCNLYQVKRELYLAFSDSKYFVWNAERITFVPEYAKLATSIGACYAEKLRRLAFDPVLAKPLLRKGANQLYFDVKNLFYFLPCSFLREVIGQAPDTIFDAGQPLFQLDSDSVAKVRSNWRGAQLSNNIRRQDFEGKIPQFWGGYDGSVLADTLNMNEDEFRGSIKIQFEVNQKLEFTLLFCNGNNPHYMIPSADELNSIDAGQKMEMQPVISEGKVVCDIAVNVSESATALKTDAHTVVFEAAKDYSKELKVFWNEDEVERQGLISAPLPSFPLSGKHIFYFQVRRPDENNWELIGELPKPKNKTEYPCEYHVTLDEKGILQIHAGEVPYREGANKEGLKQEGYVFRTALELQPSEVLEKRDPFSGIH